MIDHMRDHGLEGSIHRYYGKYRATIVDNMDPEKLGRLKLRVPQVWGDEIHDYWAWPCFSPGTIFVPEIGVQVWVEFEFGDSDYPIWVGVGYRDTDIYDDAKANYPHVRMVQTPSGHAIEADDTSGAEKLTIKSKSGHTIVADDATESLLIKSHEGDSILMDTSKILITHSATGNVFQVDASGVSIITPSGVCKLNGGMIPINNLPTCIFSGALHGTNPKNVG
jgi:hypothetical protein